MSDSVSGTQSIGRAATLLRAIGDHHDDGARLIDLADSIGLARPTTHRILKSLAAEGLVTQDAANKRYHLGQAIVGLGLAVSKKFDFQALARPSLEALAHETGDTFYLNLRVGNEALCLIRTDGICPVKDYSIVAGTRRPLGVGAGGLAILLALPPEEVSEILDMNATSLIRHKGLSVDALKQVIARSRKLGHALMDVKGIAGVQALGVPILSARSRPVAAISVASIPSRWSSQRRDDLLELLHVHARVLEKMSCAQPW